ncbi:MAG: hypothetical protein M1833_001787 [Piccolia ochrophora]|nr:MAG: hypothetical protein M1833_001787 [Piccolia ochrophora]
MRDQGIEKFEYNIRPQAGQAAPNKGKGAIYAVSNGRNVGIQPHYHGGAEREVVEYPGACHKRFRTVEQGKAFLEDWEETSASIDKANANTLLVESPSLVGTKGLSVNRNSEATASDAGDELVKGFENIKLG